MIEPLPPHDHAGRRARARALVADSPTVALLVTSPVNVRWLTGFTGSNGSLLLTADEALLVTDARYEQRVRSHHPDVELLITSEPVADVITWVADAGLSSLGLEGTHVSWTEANRWQAVGEQVSVSVSANDGLIERLREVKDDAEIARIRRACQITTDVLATVIDDLRPGLTEREVRERLESGFIEAGAEAPAFDSIVAAGPNGAVPHHESGDRPIEAGRLVTIDCGARVDGYHADCTRTVAVGEPTEEWREIHAVVVRAQAAGRAAAVPGASGKHVDAAAPDVIESEGLGDRFVHGTGHGVGLEIHEDPAVGQRATSTLAARMTVTVEPGVYIPGNGGVRIEDTVLVTDGGHEVLTDIPHELRVL
ncbi:MAG: Xaa-Pro peptidase family protein [Nitriliruptorales bacterium]|nr:Xaa-Pro peptidase family protein [Nitriliruptorales bacterium]